MKQIEEATTSKSRKREVGRKRRSKLVVWRQRLAVVAIESPRGRRYKRGVADAATTAAAAVCSKLGGFLVHLAAAAAWLV